MLTCFLRERETIKYLNELVILWDRGYLVKNHVVEYEE